MKNKVIQSFRVAPPSVVVLAAIIATLLSALSARAASLTLAWNPNSATGLAGYRVSYGTASRSYSTSLPVSASVTNASVSNLLGGQTYYFAVTASNTAGLQSDYSSEVSYTVPAANTVPVANAQGVTTLADTARALTLTGSDADGNPLTYAVVTLPAHGTLSGTVPNLTYKPATGYSGPDSFTFRVHDGTASSAAAVVTITVAPAAANPPTQALPAPWVTADIGSGTLAGNVSVTNNTFVVDGAGVIGGTADNFRFVHQPMIGDGEIRVRLSAAQFSDPNARIGVMIRENLNSGARHAFLSLAADRRLRLSNRSSTGSLAQSYASAEGSAPIWLRLIRTNTSFTAYKSTDGQTWTQIRAFKVEMAANVYVGFAVGSGTSTTLSRATFDLPTVVP